MAILALRREDYAGALPAAAVESRCERCGVAVILAPASVRRMEAGDKPFCAACLELLLRNGLTPKGLCFPSASELREAHRGGKSD
jgi:hypothetical protein